MIALFIPGIYHSNGHVDVNAYGNIYWNNGRTATYSFHEGNATATIFPTLLTFVAMVVGIIMIWLNKPKITMWCAVIYIIDEIIYIVSVFKKDEFYLWTDPIAGFYIFSILTVALVVFCILALKKTKEGPRPQKVKTVKLDQSSVPSRADELLKYKDLLDKGILTQEEFDAKKKELLGL